MQTSLGMCIKRTVSCNEENYAKFTIFYFSMRNKLKVNHSYVYSTIDNIYNNYDIFFVK